MKKERKKEKESNGLGASNRSFEPISLRILSNISMFAVRS